MNKQEIKKILRATFGSLAIVVLLLGGIKLPEVIEAKQKALQQEKELQEEIKRLEEQGRREQAEKERQQREYERKLQLEKEKEREEAKNYDGLTSWEIYEKKRQKEYVNRMNRWLDEKYGRETEYYDIETDEYYDYESYKQLEQVRKDLERIYNEYGLND